MEVGSDSQLNTWGLLQTHARVVSAICVLLAAGAGVAIDLRIVLIPAACASLALAAGGIFAA
jgi:hypothetical protein